jgi:hypothetical protein
MWQSAEIEEISVLLVAYQRPENVKEILSRVVAAGIKNIYISLDFPKIPNPESLRRREEILKTVEQFAIKPQLQIKLSVFSQNVGCGVAVIKACDWFFDSVDLGVVIEDDCIPTPGFFSYMQLALVTLKYSEDCFTASGSRLHPPPKDGARWELNTFPIFWGWGSTSDRWKYLSEQIRAPLPSFWKYPSPYSVQSIYWRAGSRRVREGFVDTWDTLISELFYRRRIKNLSPPSSLVQNIGDDEHATHEMNHLSDLPQAREEFNYPNSLPLFDFSNNEICGKFLYNYRLRHILSTFFTKVLDRTIRFHLSDKSFVDRVRDASLRYREVPVSKK